VEYYRLWALDPVTPPFGPVERNEAVTLYL